MALNIRAAGIKVFLPAARIF